MAILQYTLQGCNHRGVTWVVGVYDDLQTAERVQREWSKMATSSHFALVPTPPNESTYQR